MPANDDTVRPIPPRYWWLKRLGGGFVVLLLVLVVLRLWWGHRAQSRLDATVAAIAAKGEPIYFEDMRIEPVPDQDNKAYHFRLALAAWPKVPGQAVVITETDWYAKEDDPNRPPDPITDNAAYLREVEAKVLQHLRAMAAAPGVDWGVQLKSPAIDIDFRHLGETRKLARLIEDAAERADAIGDEQLTLAFVRLATPLAETLNIDLSSLLGHLVQISIHAIQYDLLQRLLPALDLQVQERENSARVEAETLLAELLDESDVRQSLVRGWIGERWFIYDSTMAVIESRFNSMSIYGSSVGGTGRGHKVVMVVVGPVLINDVTYMLDYLTILADAARVADNQVAYDDATHNGVMQRLGGDPQHELPRRTLIRWLSGTFLPGLRAAETAHFRLIATRRMAATALAIRLYEIDHGQRPDTLEQLVPQYLPAVPRDPFTLDATINYRPQGAQLVRATRARMQHSAPISPLVTPGPAILYCVGNDQHDDGGRVALDSDGELDKSRKWEEGLDHWFLLDEKPQAYDPATP